MSYGLFIHSKVTMKSENELAMVQIVCRALAALRNSGVESAFAEGSVPCDTKTSVAAACAEKLVHAMFRARIFCSSASCAREYP